MPEYSVFEMQRAARERVERRSRRERLLPPVPRSAPHAALDGMSGETLMLLLILTLLYLEDSDRLLMLSIIYLMR